MRVSSKTPPRTLERATTLPEISENLSQDRPGIEEGTSSQAPRYQLRANRAPRYRSGTCGSRNCSCVQLIASEPPAHRLARGAIPTRELLMARAPEHPQHGILAIRTQRQELEPSPTVKHIIVTVEKTYASVELGVVPLLEVTLQAMHDTSPSDCPIYRFKELTQHDRGGLEFTLPAVIPPSPPSKKSAK